MRIRLKSPDQVRRFLAVMIVTMAFYGCGEQAAAPQPGATRAQAPAMYGINAQISYPGGEDRLTESAMVTVFLRKPGSRMPLAVQHFPASQLPMNVSFGNPAPDRNIELVARLSPAGQVDRSPEDTEVSLMVGSFGHPPTTHSLVLMASPAVGGPAPERLPTSPAAGSSPVSIPVSVAIEASHQFAADTVVFIVGRRPGQAMPSVVRRLSLADLPARIELTDADAMMFSNRLSTARQLDLSARVSTSGSATVSDADWVSDTHHLVMDELPEEVALTINRQVGH